MEGLTGRKEYLGTFFSRYTPPEDGQHFLQGPPGEVNSNISIPALRSAYGQVNNPAPREAKARVTNRMR